MNVVVKFIQNTSAMKKILLILLATALSCNTDESTAVIVDNGITYGAIARTLGFENAEFQVGETDSFFSVQLEEQDEEDGDLMEAVDVYISFKDNNPENGVMETSEVLLKSLDRDQWELGPDNLPRTSLVVTYAEALAATNLTVSQVLCKDQFLFRLDIRLLDGRSFTTGTAGSGIIAYNTFFSSPYCYIVNVVEPIPEDDFTGTYQMESILDGPFGPTLIGTEFLEIENGHSNTVRQVLLQHPAAHLEQPIYYTFSFVCDEVIFGKNQFTSVEASCSPFGIDAPILLGPGEENAPFNPFDDSVFEVWFVEGYLGFDGQCGFGTAPSKLRFTKQ